MSDERDEIRSRVDIVDLVGREIPLKRAGKTWKGLCPFHADRNPSFTVSPDTGRYKCWSCGESGDIFTWVMKRQNLDFVEALQVLAKEAGIVLHQRTASPPGAKAAQESAMEEALAFFRDQLRRNDSAREYCERRGLTDVVLNSWEMGYAPDVGEALAIHLRKKGHALAECKSLFLVDQDASGGYFDKFRGRLMFPIREERGALVAFGGRLLGEGHPKYINSGDTPLYRKSRILYGLNRARDRIAKDRQAVLVEGYLDVIACHSAGVTSAVASLGTALAEDHAKLLKRWCDSVVIFYDSDAAGQKAAVRALEILALEGIPARVALMPPGDDPDTLLRTKGPAAVQEAVDGALTPVEYHLRGLAQRSDPVREDYWAEVIQILTSAASEAEIDRHLLDLAASYPWVKNQSEAAKILRSQIMSGRRRKRTGYGQESAASQKAVKTGLSSAEAVLFSAILDEALRTAAWRFLSSPDLFETLIGERLAWALLQPFSDGAPEGRPVAWIHLVEPEELRQTLSDLTMDFQGANLSESKLADAVKRMIDSRDTRERVRMLREGADRNAIFERAKAKKQDPLNQKKDDHTLF